MPPKRGDDAITPPSIIGSFGSSLKTGVVGKSTFFNVLTNSQASVENFPLCSVDPNERRVPVPEERLDFLCQDSKPASNIPAFLLVNVVGTAGLIEGAHNGQSPGNVISY